MRAAFLVLVLIAGCASVPQPDLYTLDMRFGEISAAVQRAAQSQRLKLSADAAVAAVDKVAQPYLPAPEVLQAPPEPEVVVIQQPPQIIEVIYEPYYVPVPYGLGSGRFPHRRRMRDQLRGGFPGGGGCKTYDIHSGMKI